MSNPTTPYYRLFSLKSIIASGALFFFFLLLFPQNVFAFQDWNARTQCDVTTDPSPPTVDNISSGIKFTITGSSGAKSIKDAIAGLPQSTSGGSSDALFPGELFWYTPYDNTACYGSLGRVTDRSNAPASLPQGSDNRSYSCVQRNIYGEGQHEMGLWYYSDTGDYYLICKASYEVFKSAPKCHLDYTYDKTSPNAGNVNDTSMAITVDKFEGNGAWLDNSVKVVMDGTSLGTQIINSASDVITFPIPDNLRTADPSKDKTDHSVIAYMGTRVGIQIAGTECDRTTVPVYSAGKTNICSPQPNDPKTNAPVTKCEGDYAKYKDANCSWCEDTSGGADANVANTKALCDQVLDPNDAKQTKQHEACVACMGKKGLWTALGCIPTNFTSIVNEYILTYGIGIAGGMAFLRFLYGAFLILTSGGNPETLEEAKQIITSSIVGLLIVIFSVFFLQTIGVDILQLPNWTSQNKTACVGRAQSACTSPCVWGLIPGSSITGCY